MTAAINRILGRRRTLLASDTGNPVAAGLLNNLILYGKMEDNTLDVGPVATLTESGPPTYAAGKVNNAASFNGVNQWHTIANASMGSLKVTGDFSVACWFKTDVATGFGENVAAWFNFSGNQRAWWIHYVGVNDEIFFAVSANGSSAAANYANAQLTSMYGGSHDPNQWIFCVCTYDDTARQATINLDNGNKTASATKTNAGVHSSTADFHVARDPGGRLIQGDVDELGMWSRVLTSEEIAYLYNSGTGRTYPFT